MAHIRDSDELFSSYTQIVQRLMKPRSRIKYWIAHFQINGTQNTWHDNAQIPALKVAYSNPHISPPPE
ncbi:hypothetical protein CHS0354_022524 [Potamilus streckersoni]|uniref:Uncharacterized protein n=1 Tax=Potamilus streckersoni TaxID=2493646 RepID=A0AAE0S752_9BIVA|nr:hypothetical protein CHS0354_022524 [Potamilus streckersoni]